MRNLASSTLLLSLVLVAGCACPPVAETRQRPCSDPSGGTFPSSAVSVGFSAGTKPKKRTRPGHERRPRDKAKPKADETDHAAALTIR